MNFILFSSSLEEKKTYQNVFSHSISALRVFWLLFFIPRIRFTLMLLICASVARYLNTLSLKNMKPLLFVSV